MSKRRSGLYNHRMAYKYNCCNNNVFVDDGLIHFTNDTFRFAAINDFNDAAIALLNETFMVHDPIIIAYNASILAFNSKKRSDFNAAADAWSAVPSDFNAITAAAFAFKNPSLLNFTAANTEFNILFNNDIFQINNMFLNAALAFS